MKHINPAILQNMCLSILAFLSYIATYGQEKPKDWRLKICLKEQNVSFAFPNDYIERDAGFNYDCWDATIADGLVYSMVNIDSSVLIALSFNPYPSESMLSKIMWWNPSYDPDSSYIKTIRRLADTVNSKINWHPKWSKKAKAEVCAAFSRNCRINVLEKYPNNRFVLFAKKGRGFFTIVYFYTDEAKPKIDNEINRTAGMLKFR